MMPSGNGGMDVHRTGRLYLEKEKECKEDLSEVLKSLDIHSPKWPKDDACLIRGTQKLQDDLRLRVPVAREPYLNCKITSEEFNTDGLPWQNGCSVTGALSQMYQGRVVNVFNLTSLAIQKPKLELTVDLEHNVEIIYEPGDAFYFIVPNAQEEVDFILERMGFLEVADRKLITIVKAQATAKNAALPPYIPEISTLRYILTWCLDIRRSPGRAKSECQKRRIMELCSAQGVEEFTKFVRQTGLSLVDFLLNFPSCRPTIERLIELLPRLLPRPYSVSCVRELWGKRIRFIFSLVCFNATDGRRFSRFGLSSGWLSTLKEGEKVLMFLKESSRFRLPPPAHSSFDLARIPLLMICTGTALAPFLSFLQKLEFLEAEKYKVRRELYYGIRNIKDDCIHYQDIMRSVDENILSHVSLCESQPCNGIGKKYVQDALRERGREISDILFKNSEDESHPAMIFVCGSSKQILKDVGDMFLHIFMDFLGKSKEDAELLLKELRKNDRFVEDVW
uniref:Methionine synthase reductase n=1 Tax=Elaeophora elaphi TaxID=1147741 RepID=A0A0R3RWV9_9BILA